MASHPGVSNGALQPANNFVNAMLTDFYQLTMAYAYFKSGTHESPAVFELYFRKNPFKGEFTVFAGLEEVIKYLATFKFTEDDISYLRTIMPHADEAFIEWLSKLDCSKIKVWAVPEGTVVFPLLPLIRVEGPLAVAQLLETTMLTLVNFPSLIATNAARMRLAAGADKTLVEFGLRRAQGPDGGVSASRYAYLGGFDGTSDVLAGKLFKIPVVGTHAHAFVSSFTSMEQVPTPMIKTVDGTQVDFVKMVTDIRAEAGYHNTNEGELAAFIAYAQAFPSKFTALVDTYDTLHSGVPNFLAVAIALKRIGYEPLGIRLDSGDLAYLSIESRKLFKQFQEKFNIDLSTLRITASNDLNEETILSLNQQGHSIDVYGVGTHLVTCQAQPALGCVYKLVEVDGKPRIKLSDNISKVTIPGRKEIYRLFGSSNEPVLDIMALVDSPIIQPTKKILARHPFNEAKRAYVIPTAVEKLHVLVWDNGKLADEYSPLPDTSAIKERVTQQIAMLRPDYKRALNPTPYKVSITADLYQTLHNLWHDEAIISEIS